MPSLKYAKLHGARVLLVGGTSGIGFAIAEASIEAGATVVISSSTSERLSSALSQLKTSYPEAAAASRIHGRLCDLSQASTLDSSIRALLEFATNSNTRKLSHITYTAADAPKFPALADYQAADTKSASIDIRYEAPIVLGKLAPAYMKPGPISSITFTGASTASKPTPGRGILTGIGASTEGVAKGLAVDLAPIRVNVVAPGTTDTPLLEALVGTDRKIREMLKKATLLDKVGAPEDVAEAYVYLMKDANITGAIIHTDGGRLLK